MKIINNRAILFMILFTITTPIDIYAHVYFIEKYDDPVVDGYEQKRPCFIDYPLTNCTNNKIPNNKCPDNNKYFKYCACDSKYKYTYGNCGNGYKLSGNQCDGKYEACIKECNDTYPSGSSYITCKQGENKANVSTTECGTKCYECQGTWERFVVNCRNLSCMFCNSASLCKENYNKKYISAYTCDVVCKNAAGDIKNICSNPGFGTFGRFYDTMEECMNAKTPPPSGEFSRGSCNSDGTASCTY